MRYEINLETGETLELPDVESGYVPPTIEELRAQMPPLTALQIRKVLNQYDLRAQVEAAVTASTDQVLKDAWEFATEYKRDDAVLNAMVTQLGLSQNQVDQMFQLGITL